METRPVTDLSETTSRTDYELTPTNFARTYFEQNSFQERENTEDSMTENELVTFFTLPTNQLQQPPLDTNWFRFIN